MKRLRFETTNQLDLFCLDFLMELHGEDIIEVSEPRIYTLAEVAQEIALFLFQNGIARVDELECQEGCTGCDEQ